MSSREMISTASARAAASTHHRIASCRANMRMSRLQLVLGGLGLLLGFLSTTQALQSYTNIYGQVTCYAEAVVKPESTQQLAAAVKQFAAAAEAARKPLKIRTSRSVFHSPTSFPCPYTSDLTAAPVTSSAAPSTVAVLTEDYNKILEVDKSAYTVRVQAGLKVLDLLRWADKNDMATEPGAPTNYAELTIGGVISANGHGTGSNVTASMGDIALEFTWVDAAGNIHVSDRNSPEGHGLAGGVGLIGIITEVKLQMTPPSNTKAISINMLPDGSIAQDTLGYIQTTPNIALMWRPDLKKYNAFLMSKTQEKPKIKDDHAGLVFPLPTMISNAFQLVLLPMQVDIQDTPVTTALSPSNCLTSLITVAYLKWGSKDLLPHIDGAPLDVALPQVSAIGSTNKMMAGGCEPYCTWDSEVTFDDTEFAIELDDFPAWVEDVKKIMELDLKEGGKAADRCMPFGGYVFVRFGSSNNDFSSVTSGMRNPVYVELTYAKSRKVKYAPAKYQFVQDIMEQMTLCKYKGRPHWGKNTDRTFTHPDCPIRNNLPNFDKQLALQAKYDPKKVFEPLLMKQVINRAPSTYTPKCDLRRTCFCKDDSHCAAGFACVASYALPEYKVCKPIGMKAKFG